MKNPWTVLGLHKGSSVSDIVRAWRKKVLQAHPDRGGNAEAFKEVSWAYETLLGGVFVGKRRRKSRSQSPSYEHVASPWYEVPGAIRFGVAFLQAVNVCIVFIAPTFAIYGLFSLVSGALFTNSASLALRGFVLYFISGFFLFLHFCPFWDTVRVVLGSLYRHRRARAERALTNPINPPREPSRTASVDQCPGEADRKGSLTGYAVVCLALMLAIVACIIKNPDDIWALVFWLVIVGTVFATLLTLLFIKPHTSSR